MDGLPQGVGRFQRRALPEKGERSHSEAGPEYGSGQTVEFSALRPRDTPRVYAGVAAALNQDAVEFCAWVYNLGYVSISTYDVSTQRLVALHDGPHPVDRYLTLAAAS